MLDLGLYDRVWLSRRPPAQRLIAELFLRFDYRNVDLRLEGVERLPEHPVVLAMNHTDNFNYWPLQYQLHKLDRYTATWVKGKNYEHPGVSAFMRVTNNIPIASRGYVITRDFLGVMGRRPEPEEYRALRDAVDRGEAVEREAVERGVVPRKVLEQGRDMLGRRFDPARERYDQAVQRLMDRFTERFLDLNREAYRIGCDLLVFPQGTRSVRLSRGHIGLAQIACVLGADIVPVGCNGTDGVYPGRSFRARPGRAVYRIGAPMPLSSFADLLPDPPRDAFSREAEREHRAAFQAIVDRVMDRIDGLLDEPYRYTRDKESEGTRETERFV
ncbi:MAG: lysophospholipid acyltransferase family protein [Sandaracinaceae bacterium]